MQRYKTRRAWDRSDRPGTYRILTKIVCRRYGKVVEEESQHATNSVIAYSGSIGAYFLKSDRILFRQIV